MSIASKIADKFAGVFGGSNETEKEPINTPEQQKLVTMARNDYSHFRSERQRYEPIWREEQRFYDGDHWYGLRPAEASKYRPNSVDNVAWSQVESVTAKLCSWMPYPEMEPMEPNDEDKASDLTAYMPYELRQIKFPQKHIRAVRRMAIHGPLIYKVAYDPTVEGGSGQYRFIGQNDIVPVEFGSFFPDPRVRDFIDMQKGAAHIFHFRKPIEYFSERWPENGEKVQPDQDESDVHIYDDQSYSSAGFTLDRTPGDGTSNTQTAGLIEYWYRGRPKIMSKEDRELFKELADEKLAEGKDPSECEAKAKGVMNGIHCLYITVGGVFLEHKSYVYDHGQYPIVARTLFPEEDNPWGKGYMRDMIKPQIMLNKFAEISVETSAKMGNSGIMHETGAIKNIHRFKQERSIPGAVLEVTDINRIKEFQGVNVPPTVFNMLNYYQEMLQKIPGQFDSANGQANPNVTSGEQAKALIAAANNRLVIATELIEDALGEVFEQYIALMAQFYTTERIGRVTGRQVSISRDKLINTMPSEYEGVQEGADGMQSPATIPVQEEYVPKFDISVRIGSEKPTDREYWIQTAFNLLNTVDPVTQMPMVDGKAVQYTVQNGRMEPFDVIDQRMQREQQIMQQMQQLQQQNEQMQQQMQELQRQIGQYDEAKLQMDSSRAQTDAYKAETDRMQVVGRQQADAASMEAKQRQQQFGNVMQLAQMQNSSV